MSSEPDDTVTPRNIPLVRLPACSHDRKGLLLTHISPPAGASCPQDEVINRRAIRDGPVPDDGTEADADEQEAIAF
jgi:hypothetical protein